jgi:hypothetical protein
LAGNGATPFTSSFDTTGNTSSGTLPAGDIDETGGGSAIPGSNADDNSGFAAAAVGDVDDDGISDLAIGAPNADVEGLVDVGTVTLIFGTSGLDSSAGEIASVTYVGEAAEQNVGESVAHGGDMNGDGVEDFIIGSPAASLAGVQSGAAYLVFGDPGLDDLAPAQLPLAGLASCNATTLCGVIFVGAAAGDGAGTSVSFAGDINGDGKDDLLIGAPGAAPNGKNGAGRTYLIYGPLTNGQIDLSTVGVTTSGLVLNGEEAGDGAGESVSCWEDPLSGEVDDLLIGAPGATPLDDFGEPIPMAGYVYAVHGGTANLDDTATPGIIELSRVANGQADEVSGIVFIGTDANGEVGRSVSGEVDIDGDGVPDIIIGAAQQGWVIAGFDPKRKRGSTDLKPTREPSGGTLGRQTGATDAISFFGAAVYTAGAEGDLGGVSVGGAGDINDDGIEDLILGAPGVDIGQNIDAGKAYIVYGSLTPPVGEVSLSDVGSTVHGLVVEGFEAGDRLGHSVGGGRDLNADGIADALVGAPFADSLATTPQDAGETYVISPVSPEEVRVLTAIEVFPGSDPPFTLLEWTVTDRTPVYNVYRGSMSVVRGSGGVFTSGMTKLACGIGTDSDDDTMPDTPDATVPPMGEAFIYIATGVNVTGEGPLGPPDQSPARVNDAQCP